MHGMKERERLLLQMAVMLHDVGKYISFNNVADSSYNIIMSNEIIGLSHIEREMVALIARYNTVTLPSYDELVMESSFVVTDAVSDSIRTDRNRPSGECARPESFAEDSGDPRHIKGARAAAFAHGQPRFYP